MNINEYNKNQNVSDTFEIFLNVHRHTTFMSPHPSSSDTFMKASMETSRVNPECFPERAGNAHVVDTWEEHGSGH